MPFFWILLGIILACDTWNHMMTLATQTGIQLKVIPPLGAQQISKMPPDGSKYAPSISTKATTITEMKSKPHCIIKKDTRYAKNNNIDHSHTSKFKRMSTLLFFCIPGVFLDGTMRFGLHIEYDGCLRTDTWHIFGAVGQHFGDFLCSQG